MCLGEAVTSATVSFSVLEITGVLTLEMVSLLEIAGVPVFIARVPLLEIAGVVPLLEIVGVTVLEIAGVSLSDTAGVLVLATAEGLTLRCKSLGAEVVVVSSSRLPAPLVLSTMVLFDNCLLCFTGTGGGLAYGGGGIGGGGFFLCLVEEILASAGSFSPPPSVADCCSGVASSETLTLGTAHSTLPSASET